MFGRRENLIVLPSVFGILPLFTILVIVAAATCFADAGPDRADVLAAMKRAARFYGEEVAYRGGYVEKYSEDLSRRWGELPARDTMIWVQDPGTVSVGRVFLDAYTTTGDEDYLRYAKAAANALIAGQHPTGGWHYFIDFDPAGVQDWYERVASKCWGWEEYYHYNGNCTFDDNTSTGAADFLLDVYMTTQDPRYYGPLLKAIGFLLNAQYPLGGWPQRYPLAYDHPYDGLADYTALYTFNDDIIVGNIDFLLKAYRLLGRDEYRQAALRGMRFAALAQCGAPQAGWAQQYDMELRPRGARNCEPRALSTGLTAQMVLYLMEYYRITGDRRFLRGIPEALDWLDRCTLPEGHSDEGHTHAYFAEIGTDRPLYAHREGTSMATGRYWIDYDPGNILPGYGYRVRMNVSHYRAQYERVAALTPEQAMAEWREEQSQRSVARSVDPGTVADVIDAMDDRGAWFEDLSVSDYDDYIHNPPYRFRGISTRTFERNMRVMMDWVQRAHNP